jgi:hypothetical protein
VKLQCALCVSYSRPNANGQLVCTRLGYSGKRVVSSDHPVILPWCCWVFIGLRRDITEKCVACHIIFLCLLMYFVGFSNVRSWLADVREHADPHVTCILVGNKVDLCDEGNGSTGKHREVPVEEAELWAKEEGLLFVEASAKSGHNVDIAFEQAARDILDKIRRGVFDDDRVSASSLFRCFKKC